MDDELNKEKVPIMEIKYEKTSCYFCNEFLDSQTFKEHIIHCGQVLEKCPNSCTAYTTRRKMRSHLKECPKIEKKYCDEKQIENNRLLLLEQDITALRSVLNEEIKQRLHLITDVGSLRKHNQISDEWTQKVGDVLTTLKKCLNEESASRNNFITRCNEDVGKLFYQLQVLQDQISKLTYDTTKMYNENVIRIQKIADDNERFIRSKVKSLESIVNDLNTKCVSDSEFSTKQMTLDYDVKSIKSIVFETEEKCEKLETIIMDIDRALHQTHQNLSNLEMALYKKRILQVENNKGHLIWKIGDFKNKLNEARQFESVLRSTIFTNKQYGYLLRLEVCLNGIGRWKGRNIIACLTVLPGEYDTLLSWPCKLQADIILRDQTNNPLDIQDYIKTTIVKRKNDEFQNLNQFIYIPHKILESRQYLRNDAIFFEVKVHKTRRSI